MRTDFLTPTHIRDYAEHMAREFDLVYVTDSTKELKDQIRAAVLRVNPGVDLDSYLARWACTVGNLVWLPFSVTVPAPLPLWPFYWQVITIAHEAQHRLQFKNHGGTPFAWDYLSNEESRGQYEYEAYLTALEISPEFGVAEDPWALAATLKHYGCSQSTIDFVASQLTHAKKIIEAGGTITPTSQAAIAWLDANGPSR